MIESLKRLAVFVIIGFIVAGAVYLVFAQIEYLCDGEDDALLISVFVFGFLIVSVVGHYLYPSFRRFISDNGSIFAWVLLFVSFGVVLGVWIEIDDFKGSVLLILLDFILLVVASLLSYLLLFDSKFSENWVNMVFASLVFPLITFFGATMLYLHVGYIEFEFSVFMIINILLGLKILVGGVACLLILGLNKIVSDYTEKLNKSYKKILINTLFLLMSAGLFIIEFFFFFIYGLTVCDGC